METQEARAFLEKLGYEFVVPLSAGDWGMVYLAKQRTRKIAVKLPLTKSKSIVLSESRRIQFYDERMAHLQREHDAYVLAYGIRGVPQNSEIEIIGPQEFSNGKYAEFNCLEFSERGLKVLSRDFIVGLHMDKFDSIKGLVDRRALERTVRDCHEAGLARLDIRRENVIVSPDRGNDSPRRKPALIDFGHAIFEGDKLKPGVFEQECVSDFSALRALYRAS